MAEEQQPLPIDEGRMRALAKTLRDRYSEYDKARSSTEQQWLKNVRQYIGEYDSNILSALKPEQSRAYPKITRVKVLSIVARLHALLFPAGEKNWSVESSPQPMLPTDKLAEILLKWAGENPGATTTQDEMDRLIKLTADDIALRMQKAIDDQLADASLSGTCDYQALVRNVMFSGVLYGCGVMKGPMTVSEEGSLIEVDEQGFPRVVTQTLYRPFFEVVPVWDYYPDFSAKSFDQMDGQFQRHIYSHHSVSQLAKRDDYMKAAINDYLRDKPNGNYQKKSYETELNSMSKEQAQTQPGESNKYELIEYWGTVTGADLRGAGIDVPEADIPKTAIACVWMLGDTVIKVAKSPYPDDAAMYHQFVFEDNEVDLMGSGLPAVMRDSQLGISSFTRMLTDNAASVCGPNVEVDAGQLADSVNPTSITPFKVWLKDDASPNGARAVQNISFDSHIPALLQAITLMREFADTETFVSAMNGGDFENVSGEALRTSGNMSMALATAALPFKDIVRNYDKFTKSVINSLIQWNLLYNARRDQLNGDLRPIPRGASSLMAKEVRAVSLDQLDATLTPEQRIYINEEALLKERLSVRDLPLDKLLAAPEEVEQRKAAAAAAASEQKTQNDAMFQANLRTLQTEALKDTAQAQKNMDMADVATFNAMIAAIEKGAGIDELQQLAKQSQAAVKQQPAAGPADQGSANSVPAQ